MTVKLKAFGSHRITFFLILLINSASVANKISKTDDRERLLTEYAAFEASVQQTLMSMFSKLAEETCDVGDPNCGPAAASILPEEFDPALMLLIGRVDNVDGVLKPLLPGSLAPAVQLTATHVCTISISYFSCDETCCPSKSSHCSECRPSSQTEFNNHVLMRIEWKTTQSVYVDEKRTWQARSNRY